MSFYRRDRMLYMFGAMLLISVGMLVLVYSHSNTNLLARFEAICIINSPKKSSISQTSNSIATPANISNTTTKAPPKTPIHCYRENIASLPNISDFNPRPGKSIFFHETSCNSFTHGKIVINSRQACAVESAAKMNPDFDVYLLYASPGLFRFEENESDYFLRALLSYKNVHILHLNYENYVKGSPVETLYTSGKIDTSSYAVSHASDVLRYLTLWKYGGIYLDLDVVVIKSLQDLPLNYAGLQSPTEVAAGVVSFEPDGLGHTLADRCLKKLKKNFNGKIWGHNGPAIIAAVMKESCNVTVASDMLKKNCTGLKLYPEKSFYPVFYPSWQLNFKDEYRNDVIDITEKHNSYILHTWNKLSENWKISIKSNPAYLHFAKLYCPRVVEACREFF